MMIINYLERSCLIIRISVFNFCNFVHLYPSSFATENVDTILFLLCILLNTSIMMAVTEKLGLGSNV